MNIWEKGIQAAVEYIEQNLTEELSIAEVAEAAYLSEFHFRRIFTELCGLPIGEYIRKRRLALAAEELSGGGNKVIDIAVKYGYDSPDSFSKAFAKFHGVVPSVAKKKGTMLRDFPPLKVRSLPEEENVLEYKIVEKDAFTILGRKRRFDMEDSYQRIPEFWEEHWQDGGSDIVLGMYGLCMNSDGRYFDYYIADNYEPNKVVPKGFEVKTISEGWWAIFPCTLENLQTTNTRIWLSWLPGCREYRLSGDYNVELYTAQADHCELWLPIERIERKA